MLALESPDHTEIGADNNVHYIKESNEFGPRTFRVIVNPRATPNRVITFFFDRRLRTRIGRGETRRYFGLQRRRESGRCWDS